MVKLSDKNSQASSQQQKHPGGGAGSSCTQGQQGGGGAAPGGGTSQAVCKYFQWGNCSRGEVCFFTVCQYCYIGFVVIVYAGIRSKYSLTNPTLHSKGLCACVFTCRPKCDTYSVFYVVGKLYTCIEICYVASYHASLAIEKTPRSFFVIDINFCGNLYCLGNRI